ncbi:MAG TPA: flavin reductase [Verrucomicrobia bacterium]|nr:MAG: flavin reductase [Lentisphaerae bacterium GWF2_57_35]HBA85431.1 flavin reductase [Verrucomicrobiota bacterium]
MNSTFTLIRPEQLTDNPFIRIGADWMLVTAGTMESFNTMTASWGGWGVLWDKNVCFVFVRPTRYTFEFMEKSERFTLTFFDEPYRQALAFCGANSGRNVNKIEKTGLKPHATESGAVYFEQGRLVLECRKIYYQDLIPKNFIDPGTHEFYSGSDHHRLYVGEIEKCWRKTDAIKPAEGRGIDIA